MWVVLEYLKFWLENCEKYVVMRTKWMMTRRQDSKNSTQKSKISNKTKKVVETTTFNSEEWSCWNQVEIWGRIARALQETFVLWG